MIDTNIINLQSLIDLSARLNEFEDDEKIINSALLSLMGKLKYSRSLILIPEKDKFKVKHIRSDMFYYIDRFEVNDILLIDYKQHKELAGKDIDICIPLSTNGIIKYIICFGKRLLTKNINDEELRYAGLVTSITNNALKNAANTRELKKKEKETNKKNQLLFSLLEISKNFNALLTKKKIFKMLSFHLMGQLTITKFAVYEYIEENPKLIINKFPFSPEVQCIKNLIDTDKTLNLQNTDICSEVKDVYPDFHYAIPMKLKGNVKGMLIIGKKNERRRFYK